MTGDTVFGIAAGRHLHPHPTPVTQLETMMNKMMRVITQELAELLASVEKMSLVVLTDRIKVEITKKELRTTISPLKYHRKVAKLRVAPQ
ncbi:hypothetical protein PC123_g16056 [Phytophthora cactorum]|nr:hypothetical protein PC120_g11797 [Phytophthora cactorum]KAG4048641.1 hypothetical protein PC123_g16056 [Phytophthora cactorum]